MPPLLEPPVTQRKPPRNTTGSLTLTLRRGEELEVVTPDGDRIVVYCSEAAQGRVSLNLRAPRDFKISRLR